jgi:hypothetical protein
MLKFMKVRGHSLSPDYRDGDFVLVSTLPRTVRENDVIVFQNSVYGTLIKRVKRVLKPKSEFIVRGTCWNSVDSKMFGSVFFQDVIGKVIWHIRGK